MSINEQQVVSRVQQGTVLDTALDIFAARNEIRRDLWANYSAVHHVRSMREKLERIERALELGIPCGGRVGSEGHYSNVQTAALDDAYDLINMTAFFIRTVTGEKPDGTPA